MKIIPLSEGTFTIDKTKLFVPFDEDVHDLQERPVGSLLVEIQPLLSLPPKIFYYLTQDLASRKMDKCTFTKILLQQVLIQPVSQKFY